MQHTILIVEDDTEIQSYLREILKSNSFTPYVASEGSKALQLTKKIHPDVVILDLGLPDVSGETVCKEIKKQFPEIPVIILTANDTTESVVRGLNTGADDYLTKPFVAEELLARINARLRETKKTSPIYKIADLELNNRTLEVKRGEKTIALTQTEFQLLAYLMQNPGRVLTRQMILNHVWSYAPDIESRVVDVYVGYLRKKIDSNDFPTKLIHSIRGFGYVLKTD